LRRRNNAAERPDLPSPTTRTFLPFNSIAMPDSFLFIP
jgi:hypothetical protein